MDHHPRSSYLETESMSDEDSLMDDMSDEDEFLDSPERELSLREKTMSLAPSPSPFSPPSISCNGNPFTPSSRRLSHNGVIQQSGTPRVQMVPYDNPMDNSSAFNGGSSHFNSFGRSPVSEARPLSRSHSRAKSTGFSLPSGSAPFGLQSPAPHLLHQACSTGTAKRLLDGGLPTPDMPTEESLKRRKTTRTPSFSKIPSTPYKTQGKSRIRRMNPDCEQVHSPENFPNPSATPQLNEEERRRYVNTHFIQVRELGGGSSSTVYEMEEKNTGKRYAIKIGKAPVRENRVVSQVKIVKSLTHPHVLQYIFAWIADGILHIQTELCTMSLSSLMQLYVEQPDSYIDEKTLWEYLTDIVLGLDHIHTKGIIHLDIKPANILIDSYNNLKIADFDLARTIDSLHSNPADYSEGDGRYMAPEVMNDLPTTASDIFSLGISMFELVTLLDLPNTGQLWNELRSGNIANREDYPPHCSFELRNLIGKMMHPDPSMRPTTKDLLTHHEIQKIVQSRLQQRDKIYTDAIGNGNLGMRMEHAPSPHRIHISGTSEVEQVLLSSSRSASHQHSSSSFAPLARRLSFQPDQ